MALQVEQAQHLKRKDRTGPRRDYAAQWQEVKQEQEGKKPTAHKCKAAVASPSKRRKCK